MAVELFEALTKPTAAQLNAIAGSQAGLAAVYLGSSVARGAVESAGSGSAFGLIHQHRWLLYNSTGELIDPRGVYDAVALGDAEEAGQIGQLDLDTVEWLAVGMFYRVTGCAFAFERVEPVSG